MTEPHELIFDHLRAIRTDLADVKLDIRDLKQSMLALRTDMLRQERAIASVENDIDRIKVRLDLSDA
jgi:septal ring factor EnvC (AmiA/AmiB activator)